MRTNGGALTHCEGSRAHFCDDLHNALRRPRGPVCTLVDTKYACTLHLYTLVSHRAATKQRLGTARHVSRCFLRSCLLLTYEQALIELAPAIIITARTMRVRSRTHARSAREVNSRNANTASSCSCCESRNALVGFSCVPRVSSSDLSLIQIAKNYLIRFISSFRNTKKVVIYEH